MRVGWILADSLCLTAGIMLVMKGIRSYQTSATSHCRACDCNVTGIESSVCPECGQPLSPETICSAGRYRRPWLVFLGAVVSVAAIALVICNGLLWQPPRVLSPNRYTPGTIRTVKVAQKLLAQVRLDFVDGSWSKNSVQLHETGNGIDRLSSLGESLTRSQRRVRWAITDASDARALNAAMKEIDTAILLYTSKFGVLPSVGPTCYYSEPLSVLDQIDSHLNELLRILEER